MDLKLERTQAGRYDRRWLANWAQVVGSNHSVTVRLTDFVQATHYPEYFLPPGLLLGQYTAAGPDQGFWGPYDPAATDGREVALGAVFSDFHIRRDSQTNAVIGTEVAGAILMFNQPVQVYSNLLPGTLNGGAAYQPLPADLPAGWTAIEGI